MFSHTRKMILLLALLIIPVMAGAEPWSYLVKMQSAGKEKKIEDFSEYSSLESIWQFRATYSKQPLTKQILLLKVPSSKVSDFVSKGYTPIAKLAIYIEVSRVGYCMGWPSGTNKKSARFELDTEKALYFFRSMMVMPFETLQKEPSSSDLYRQIIASPRQDNGWKFNFYCRLGIFSPVIISQMEKEVAAYLNKPDYKIDLPKNDPFPVLEYRLESAWVNNTNQGPAKFQTPMNLGDLSQAGASLRAGMGFDLWVKDVSFNKFSDKTKPYVEKIIWKTSGQSFIGNYEKDSFMKYAVSHLKLVDK
ncbi:MAG: hypothetical protein HQM10_09370 [Candidatus Riflebacteria bacterium]|nr:hypothetical protein [Candidatus Riflebacteria bacterium]